MEKLLNANVAVLVACHNRRQKTMDFLQSLINQHDFDKFNIDIYLLDDGSADGTADAVSHSYPFVNVVKASGNLFWAGGMRTIWQYACERKTYDVFLLFNDDVILLDGALGKLLCGYDSLNKTGIILVGSTLSPVTQQLSYGGYNLYNNKYSRYYAVEPDEKEFIPCAIGNANILLVDAATVNLIGIFADEFTHGISDFDYTYTAHKAGLNVYVAPGYYGYCYNDHGVNWLPGTHSLKKRIKFLYSPKGLAYNEYLSYIKKHYPAEYFSAFLKLWMKTLFPIIWDKFKAKSDKQ